MEPVTLDLDQARKRREVEDLVRAALLRLPPIERKHVLERVAIDVLSAIELGLGSEKTTPRTTPIGKPPIYTEHDVERITALATQGMTNSEISQVTGISTANVFRLNARVAEPAELVQEEKHPVRDGAHALAPMPTLSPNPETVDVPVAVPVLVASTVTNEAKSSAPTSDPSTLSRAALVPALEGKDASKRSRARLCGRCKQPGHYARTCMTHAASAPREQDRAPKKPTEQEQRLEQKQYVEQERTPKKPAEQEQAPKKPADQRPSKKPVEQEDVPKKRVDQERALKDPTVSSSDSSERLCTSLRAAPE